MITLPVTFYGDREVLQSELTDEINKFLKSLLCHELGHYIINFHILFNSIKDTIVSNKYFSENNIRTLWNSNNLNTEFDNQTNHGCKENRFCSKIICS